MIETASRCTANSSRWSCKTRRLSESSACPRSLSTAPSNRVSSWYLRSSSDHLTRSRFRSPSSGKGGSLVGWTEAALAFSRSSSSWSFSISNSWRRRSSASALASRRSLRKPSTVFETMPSSEASDVAAATISQNACDEVGETSSGVSTPRTGQAPRQTSHITKNANVLPTNRINKSRCAFAKKEVAPSRRAASNDTGSRLLIGSLMSVIVFFGCTHLQHLSAADRPPPAERQAKTRPCWAPDFT